MQNKLGLSFESEHKSRILTASTMRELVGEGRLITPETFSELCLNSASYDIRIGKRIVYSGTGKIQELRENDTFNIAPGSYVGIISRECVAMPLNVLAMLGTKRKFSYEGLILLTGSYIDPGYNGHLLFTVYNASNKPAFLQFEDKLCTVVFHQLDVPAKGHFHDSSLIEGKFPGEFVRGIGQTDPSGYATLKDEIAKLPELQQRLARLETEYNDVRGPIKELTKLVENVTADLQEVKTISQENTLNIRDLAEASRKARERLESHDASIIKGEAHISWLKWGITALIGSLALYWIINALLPLIKSNSSP